MMTRKKWYTKSPALLALWAFAGTVALGPAAVAQSQLYAIAELDFGAQGGAGSGINASGQVAGSSASSPTSAFITGADGIGITFLAVPDNSGAQGINSSGQVVVVLNQGGLYDGFITGANGTGVTPLPTLLGGNNTYPYAINDSGQVTGFSGTQPDVHAFITGTDGVGIIDLGTLGGGTSAGYAINVSGQVTGYSTANQGSIPFITGANGLGMHAVTNLGGDYSGGLGINNAGQITGYSNLVANGPYHAFVTGPNGAGIADLGTFGGTYSMGRAINASGQVTGGADISSGSGQHAFLYSRGVMTDLNTLINPHGALAPFVTLQYGTAITDAGVILVVGSDSRYPGVSQTFILTPASPLSLACPTSIAQVGTPYSSKLSATGGFPPYLFSVTGTLPAGLTLISSTGAITGTPSTPNSYGFTAQVADSSGMPSGTIQLKCTITVSPRPDFSIAASPVSIAVTQGLSATSLVSAVPIGGFTGSIALTASGAPPGASISFSPTTIAGTTQSTLTFASGTAPAGTYSIKVLGTSGALQHTISVSVTITSSRRLSISPTHISFGTVHRFALVLKIVKVENVGTAPVEIAPASITSVHETERDDFIPVSNCRRLIKPGDSCWIAVVLFAKSPGTLSAVLHVPNNAVGSLQSVPLSAIVTKSGRW
jgi:probable HAF family extracellular repeat protein